MQVRRQSGWTPPHPDHRCLHLHHPPNFTPDAIPAATLPIYPGLGQAPNMLDCILGGLVLHPTLHKTGHFKDTLFSPSLVLRKQWQTQIRQSQIADFTLPIPVPHSDKLNQTLVVWYPTGAATWQTSLKYIVMHDSRPLVPHYENISSTKLKVNNISQRRQMRTKPRTQATCIKIGNIGLAVFELYKWPDMTDKLTYPSQYLVLFPKKQTQNRLQK